MPWLWLVPGFVWKGLAISAVLGGAYWYVHNQGAQSAVAKIEAANVKTVSVAQKGRANSRSATTRGVRDPYAH